MGTCGQRGYVFWDFCLEQGIEFIIFCLNQGIDLSIFVLNWLKCLKQGIKNRNSVLKWVVKSAIFFLNRVRVWGAAPHLPNQGYIEYSPPPPGHFSNGRMLQKRGDGSHPNMIRAQRQSWQTNYCVERSDGKKNVNKWDLWVKWSHPKTNPLKKVTRWTWVPLTSPSKLWKM